MADKHWDHDGDDTLHHMMKGAFDNQRQLYQDHRDAKIHYLARTHKIHSWERPEHQTRRFENEKFDWDEGDTYGSRKSWK